ncbi:MAG: hypothetical protein Pg6C_14870 [Treponemataceae bacterium]|nr:MAG: hypothetical protein Pg6C_14870 [Treponemataceae bacterium]
MNTNLLNIVKRIAAEQGEGILGDPQRLKAFFGDLAKDEPKPLRVTMNMCASSGNGDFFTNQFPDDLGGGFMGCYCFGIKIVKGKVVQPHHAGFPPADKAAAVGSDPGRCPRPQFIKGIIFFFGQIRHGLLLSVEHFDKSASAFHGVKHPHGIRIQNIVKHFNQIGGAIETDKQVLIQSVRFFQHTVKFFCLERPTNIRLGNAMLERRLSEMNYKAIHAAILAHCAGRSNTKR